MHGEGLSLWPLPQWPLTEAGPPFETGIYTKALSRALGANGRLPPAPEHVCLWGQLQGTRLTVVSGAA